MASHGMTSLTSGILHYDQISKTSDRKSLDGSWLFFHQKYLWPKDYIAGMEEKGKPIQVPGMWSHSDLAIPEYSFGTYLLELRGVPINQELGIAGMLAIENGALFAFDPDGVSRSSEAISKIGSPGTDRSSSRPKILQMMGPLPVSSKGRLILMVHVSNFHNIWGGVLAAPEIGPRQMIVRDITWKRYINFFILGMMLIVAAIHLLFFTSRTYDMGTMWIGLFTLIMALRYVGTENILEYVFPEQSDFVFWASMTLRNVTMPLALACYMWFYKSSFPSFLDRRLPIAASVVSVIYASTIACADMDLVSILWLPVYSVFMVFAVFLGVAEVLARKAEALGSTLALVGMVILLSCSVNDFLVFTQVYNAPYLAHWAVLVFILINTLINNMRIRKAVEEKSLHETNLQAAQIVQKSLLPHDFPHNHLNIKTKYVASEQVGGDWYNWFYDERKNWFFVVLGDVTGHGLGSAMVTATVTGAFRASCMETDRSDTATVEKVLELLNSNMNSALYGTGHGDQKLMTQVMIGLDLSAGRGYYLNSGHEPIYLKTGGRLKPLLVPGTPLGVRIDPKRKVTPFSFTGGDRLFLYTDGLTECMTDWSKNRAARQLRKVLKKESPLEDVHSEISSIFEVDHLDRDDDCTWVYLENVG